MAFNLRTSFGAAMAILFTQALFAHGGSKGPHGGTVQDFGDKYHMEGVAEGGTAKFYLLDGDGKAATLEKHEGGSITVLATGKKPETTPISKDGAFTAAEAPLIGQGKLTATVNVKSGGKSYSAKFKFEIK